MPSFRATLAPWQAITPPLRVLAPGRIRFANPDLAPIAPCAFRLAGCLFLPPAWPILTPDGRLIVDDVTAIPAALKRGGIGGIAHRGDGTYDVAVEAPVAIDEPVVFLPLTPGYFHWLLDCLARLLCLGDVAAERRIVLPGEPLPYMMDSLAMAGIPPERLWWLPGGRALALRDAVVVSNLSLFGSTHKAAIAALRALAPPAGRPRRRLYVSRADAATRRLLNDAEVARALAPLGFETVIPGSLSFAEQTGIFRDAECIVGAHGAGLANLVWAADCRGLVELVPESPFLMQYRYLAGSMEVPYARLTAEPHHCFGPHKPDAHFAIDPQRARAAAEAALT